MRKIRETFVVLLALMLASCTRPSAQPGDDAAGGKPTPNKPSASSPSEPGGNSASPSSASPSEAGGPQNLETITLGAGCFWCVEAVFAELRGVKSVVSGYSGGQVLNPTYQAVCSGTTGHAEVVQVTFDPREIPLHDILEVFFSTHDPTTLNRQGADSGTQYRSAIFYTNEEQKRVAEQVKSEMQKEFSSPIVTEITPFTNFYKAEQYHQEYYALNPNQGYCRVVIDPKMAKFRKKYKDRLKSPAAH